MRGSTWERKFPFRRARRAADGREQGPFPATDRPVSRGEGWLQLLDLGFFAFGGRSVKGPRSEGRVGPRHLAGMLVLTPLRSTLGVYQRVTGFAPCTSNDCDHARAFGGILARALVSRGRHLFAAAAVATAASASLATAQPILETVTNRERAYVHAELVVTRRLLHSTPVRLLEALPVLEDVDGAMVVPHGPPEPVEFERDGIAFEGVRQRFSVFPERSGPLVIPEANVRLSARGQAPGDRGQVWRVVSPPMAIDVMPMPDSYPANSAWFPAEDVTLRDEWPATSDLGVGKPIDRVLTVTARGAPASAIPPLIARSPDAFRSYPAPAELNEGADRVVIGERVERRTLIPTRAGAFVVPSVEVVWWNTRTDTLATTIAPVKRLTVTGAAPTADPERPAETASTEDFTAEGPAQAPDAAPNMPWPTLVLAVLAPTGWCLAIYLAARNRRNRRHAENNKPPSRTAPSLQALLRRLPKRSPTEAKAMILDWLSEHWHQGGVQALQRLQSTETGQDLLNALNAPIYAQRPDKPKDLESLLRAVVAQDEDAGSAMDPLPPLYPTTPGRVR